MIGKRINKFWFSLKVLFIMVFLYISILFVCDKEFVEDEYCASDACAYRAESEGVVSLWEDFVATFCMYPDCD